MNEHILKTIALYGTIIGLLALYLSQQFLPIPPQNILSNNANIVVTASVSAVYSSNNKTTYTLSVPITATSKEKIDLHSGDLVQVSGHTYQSRNQYNIEIDSAKKISVPSIGLSPK